MGAALDLLHHLRGAGLVLTLMPAGGLHVAPRIALTDDHRAAIRANLDALVLALQAEAAQAPAAGAAATTSGAAAAAEGTSGEALREAFEERAAILEYEAGLQRGEAERLAAQALVLDADRACWLHSSAMNSQELGAFAARLAHFTDKGLHHDDAEALADRLVLRDRDGDDRRLCLECSHLQGARRWRCGNWERAGMAPEGLAPELVLMLQRCPGFAPAAGLSTTEVTR